METSDQAKRDARYNRERIEWMGGKRGTPAELPKGWFKGLLGKDGKPVSKQS